MTVHVVHLIAAVLTISISYTVFGALNRVNGAPAATLAVLTTIIGGQAVVQIVASVGVVGTARWLNVAAWASALLLNAFAFYGLDPPNSYTPAWKVKWRPFLAAAFSLWALLDVTGAIRY